MKASVFVKAFVVFVLIAAVACIAVVAVCNPPYKDAETPDRSDVKILYLGDSIAEGVAGPSPVIERQSIAYASILGRINGFTYVNRAVSGHRTQDMLEYVSREKDENAYTHVTHIKTADIICVSILGNDLLQTDFNVFARDALDGDFTKVDAILEKSYENVDGIVKRLKELNPNATLIFQTVYNPMYPESRLLHDSTKALARQKGYSDKDFYKIGGLLINRMNNVLPDYLMNNPGAFVLVDVNKKFDTLYRANDDRLKRMIFTDGVHPSTEGHAVITSAIQQTLEELGLTNHDSALKKYKELCVERMNKLYADADLDKKGLKKQIMAATTYDAVNDAYFNTTDKVTPTYETDSFVGEKEAVKNSTFPASPDFTLEKATVWGNDITGVLDENKTGISFSEQNGFELKLQLNDLTLAGAGVAMYTMAGDSGVIDLSEYMRWLDEYVTGIFPTESMHDLNSLLSKITTDLGIYLLGVDMGKEEIVKLFDDISEKEKVDTNAFEFPEELGLVLRGSYEMTTVPSVTQQGGYKAAYLGKKVQNTEPYFIVTFYEENGVEKALFHNEVLKADVVMSRVKK